MKNLPLAQISCQQPEQRSRTAWSNGRKAVQAGCWRGQQSWSKPTGIRWSCQQVVRPIC